MNDAPPIVVENLSFRYPRSSNTVLEGVGFRVEPGEKLGVLGPNGGGKSTLLKLMLGLLPVEQGRIEILGRSPLAAQRAGLLGYLPQRIRAELSSPLSVMQVIRMPILVATRPTADDDAHIARMLALMDLEALAHRPVGALSGGQLQRVMIARALARRPKILVLDEPTVGIDISGQRRFADMLDALHRELDLTLVIVSHELRTIVTGSTRIACLARTMHFHGSAEGLTPAILEQVFRHDVTGILSPGTVCSHGHAHTEGEGCCADH